jgi:hypothetical protein
LITASLQVLQPLARSSGRIGGPPASRPPRPERFALPRPRALEVWTQIWQSGDRRLRELEGRLRSSGAIVARGGPFDHWDLHVRGGLFAAARVRFGVEEHGDGCQLVRVALVPSVSRHALLLLLLLLSLSSVAFVDSADLAGIVLAGAAITVGAFAMRGAGFAMGVVLQALKGVRVGAPREVQSVTLETT